MKGYLLSLLTLSALFTVSQGLCTWPSPLEGTWYTSQSTNWTFDASLTYLTLDFATYGQQNFDCYNTDGYRYLARITNITVFPAIPSYLFDIFICLEFQQLSTNSFLVWRANNVNPTLSNEKAYMREVGYQTTTSAACEIAKPYTAGTHDVIVKAGQEASAAVTCPSEFNAVSSYYYDYGTARECGPSNSSVDGCTATDSFSFNYTACADNSIYMLYSYLGSLYCLYFTTDSGVTYLNLYNKDSNPSNPYYRFSCLVFAQSGSVTFATQYPGSCDSTQTTTFVFSPGEDLYFSAQSTCVANKTHGVLSGGQHMIRASTRETISLLLCLSFLVLSTSCLPFF